MEDTKDNPVYGFAAELHKSWLYPPAFKVGNLVTVSNVSGFGVSWEMRNGGVFFPEEGGGCFCPIAMKKASEYCRKMEEDIC